MARRGWFFRIRVAFLLSILFLVLLFAWNDHRRRTGRNDWQEPLRVGIVLLQLGSVAPGAVEALSERVGVLEERLSSEYLRYQSNGIEVGERTQMFQVIRYGPLNVLSAPPSALGDALWDRARHAYALWRYTRRVDSDLEIPTRGLDSRIYVLARSPVSANISFVEGFSQSGGHFGVANVELSEATVDLALSVVAHELFHTLGATDKYDERGRTLIPDGLPEPNRVPRFPQPGVEVMARNRVLDATTEVPLQSLAELWVGPITAREVGWTN